VTRIRDKHDLTAALSQPRAFVFLYVNWAGQARYSEVIVRKVLESWDAEYPDQPVPCYTVDVSDQCGELWDALAEWLMAEGRPAGHLMMSGVGPLLWLRAGHVALHVLAPLQFGAAKLAAVSRSVFAEDA
jgi:hypothetical protein